MTAERLYPLCFCICFFFYCLPAYEFLHNIKTKNFKSLCFRQLQFQKDRLLISLRGHRDHTLQFRRSEAELLLSAAFFLPAYCRESLFVCKGANEAELIHCCFALLSSFLIRAEKSRMKTVKVPYTPPVIPHPSSSPHFSAYFCVPTYPSIYTVFIKMFIYPIITNNILSAIL